MPRTEATVGGATMGGATMDPGVTAGVFASGTVSGTASGTGGAGSGATTLELGRVLGNRYEILAVLGEGGMGAVYKVHDREVGGFAALKVIRPEMANRPEVLQRFKQELILARQVTHKNVIRIHDLGEADGVKFITMDFVEGHDLSSMIRERGKFQPEEAAAIIAQVCRALDAAHSEGVVHRDLKPQNIMLDVQGRVKVMDFGIARSTEAAGGMTQTGALLGTPEYMSPEQAKGQHVDARSDLFSLGIIFYEMLTGKTPFHAETMMATIFRRTQERARPPLEHDPTIPQWINDVVMKCLASEPEDRFQSAQEIVDAVEGRTEGRAGVGLLRPLGLNLHLPRFPLVKRLFPIRIVPAAVGLAIIMCLAIAAYIGYRLKRPSGPKAPHTPIRVLVADFNNYTGDPIFNNTLEPMMGVALEGASFINAYNRGSARKLAEKLPHPTAKLDEQSARLVAISQGVSAVITGEISRRGNHYSVTATALDSVTGNLLAQAEVNPANKDQVLFDIPKLAAPIRRALGDTTPVSVQIERAGGAFKTSNLEAVHQYGLAMEQEFAGNIQGALQLFSKAAELDPNFARAYAGMAGQASNLGRQQDAVKYAKLAMEHVDRMTERERFRIRGVYYMAVSNWQECAEDQSQLVKQYPSDNIGFLNLAICSAYLHEMPRAVEAARRAVELAPKNLMARNNFSLLACYAADFHACERGGVELERLNPSLENGYLLVAYAQQGQGQLAQAAETYRKVEKLGARGASLAASGLANLALYEGRYRQAVQILEKGVAADIAAKEPDRAADHFAMLAHAEILRGEKQAAIAAAEKALANSQSAKIQFLAARAFVEAGENARAQRLASSLGSKLDAEPQAYAKLILGEDALKNHDPRQALQLFTDAKKLSDTWMVHFDLGLAYLEASAFVEANSEFDKCMQRRGEALELFMDDMPTYEYFPPVYYYQGRALEGLKSPDAAKFYRTYLSIRGKAGEDPLLSDVRQRLAQLSARLAGK